MMPEPTKTEGIVRCEGCGNLMSLPLTDCLICSKLDERYRKEKLHMQNQINGGNE